MAEFVSGLATFVLEKLATKAYQEIALAWGLKKDVQRLQDSMRIINAVLKDAENKQDTTNGITEWLQKLKHAFLDAGDVLDEIECEALRSEVVKKYGSVSRKVCRFFSSSNQIAFSFKMAHKIKDIRKRIDEIASWRANLGLVHDHHAHDLFLSERETHSHVIPSLVIGRDKEKEQIINYLINPQPHDNGIDVVPIVGIGGMGKTTLAKLVYNNERVKGYFDLRAWVCVSNEFNVQRIALGILKSLGRKGSNDENLQQVQTRLRYELQQKTFFIVMDDVWNVDRKKWLELTTLLIDICSGRNKNGNKIIITTCDNRVAAITKTTFAPQFNLRELSEDECLKVFAGQAFRAGDKEKYPRLVEIGKEIIKKCKGVPLALVSLGCLLYSKVDENKWKEVRDSEIWELDEHCNNILPALRLSYNHLSSPLKQCVSYCSIFPKDYVYLNDELISFWSGHGLLQSSNENLEPEDLGYHYINELLSKFFFQDLEKFDFSSGVFHFKMHNLIHDLAMSTMKSEVLAVTPNSKSINGNERHLLVSKNDGVPHFQLVPKKARTYGFWSTRIGENTIIEPQHVTWIGNQFKYLRVLGLQWLQLRLLPDCFSKMKLLRYLDLSYCYEIEELPESICKLQNLQFLSLWACHKLKKLPKNMKILVSLRVLELTIQKYNLSNCGIWCLESLQILSFYECENLISLPYALSHLTSLKKLRVWWCSNFINFEEEPEEGKRGNKEAKDLSLRELSILALPKLTSLPRWLKRSAKTMQHVFIHRCPNLTVLPEWLPNLTALEILLISECPQLIAKCQRDGPDYYKIAHVSNVILHGEIR